MSEVDNPQNYCRKTLNNQHLWDWVIVGHKSGVYNDGKYDKNSEYPVVKKKCLACGLLDPSG